MKSLFQLILLIFLPLLLHGQAGTSITLEGIGYNATFPFSDEEDGKNNYVNNDGQGVYWSSFENKWIAAINEEFFAGNTIGTSDYDGANPPSLASGLWECYVGDFSTDCIDALSGTGTVTPPYLTDPLPSDATYDLTVGSPCSRSYSVSLDYKIQTDATSLVVTIYLNDEEYGTSFGQDDPGDPTRKTVFVGLEDVGPVLIQPGQNTIRLEAEDSENITSTTEFTLSAPDNESPFITCPADIEETAVEVMSDGNGGFVWASSEIPDVPVEDECNLTSEVSITLRNLQTGSVMPWTLPNRVTLGEWRVQVSADNGNTNVCTFDVTLNPQPAPVLVTGPATVDLIAEGCPLNPDFTFDITMSQPSDLIYYNEDMSASTGITDLTVTDIGDSEFTIAGTITDPSDVSLSIIFDSGSNGGTVDPSSFSDAYQPTFMVPVCGCTEATSVNFDPMATLDDGSCAGDLSCVEDPEPTPNCMIENNFGNDLPCYDIDGDGNTDIGIGNPSSLEGGYWGETSAYVKQFSNPSTTFPLVVSESDLQDDVEGFSLECGNCSVVVVFILESGKTGYVTASSDGTVTNMGLTTADEITFKGLNECPSTCAVAVDGVEVTSPQCTDDLGSVTVTASCDDCTNDLEYKLNDGDWQAFSTFDDLTPDDYTVTVREVENGATDCEVTKSFTITDPADTEVPDVTCPTQSVDRTLDSQTGTYEITEADIMAALSGVTDNCTEAGQLVYASSQTMFTCADIGGTNEVQFTVTDEADNTATCDVEVKIILEIPDISIADAELVEGNTGNTDMTFTVSRTSASCPVSINWQTAGNTATENCYYVIVTRQPLNFYTCESSKDITVSIIGDEDLEEDETFRIVLSYSGFFASIVDGEATGTIINDEVVPNYSVNGMMYETLQDAIDALAGSQGNIFLDVDDYEDSSVFMIPANVVLVVSSGRSLTFTSDITVAGELASSGTITGNITVSGKYYGGGTVNGNFTNNGTLQIGGELPVQAN